MKHKDEIEDENEIQNIDTNKHTNENNSIIDENLK